MEHTHEFDCPICGSHLDSRDQLEQHTRQAHRDGGQHAGGSGRTGSMDGSATGNRSGGRDDSRLA